MGYKSGVIGDIICTFIDHGEGPGADALRVVDTQSLRFDVPFVPHTVQNVSIETAIALIMLTVLHSNYLLVKERYCRLVLSARFFACDEPIFLCQLCRKRHR